jgi:hypothetical protein
VGLVRKEEFSVVEPRKNKHRVLQYHLIVMLVLVSFVLVSAHAENIAARYFCTTADPLGLTYTDALRGIKARLWTAPVYQLLVGDGGYCAITYENKIEVYRFKRHIFTLQRPEPQLLSWCRTRLLFSSQSRLYILDAKARQLVQAPFSMTNELVAWHSLSQGSLSINQHNDEIFIKLYNEAGEQIRRWKTHGNFQKPHFIVINNRYAVVELSDPQKKYFLWIIDTQSGNQKSFALSESSMGFCQGISFHSILVSLPVNYTVEHRVRFSRFVSINVDNLQQHVLFEKEGQRDLVGITEDVNWIIVTRPYAEVGPGELIAINIKTGKERMLQKNVYKCYLTTQTQAATYPRR